MRDYWFASRALAVVMFAFAVYTFLIWARKRERRRDLAMTLLFLIMGLYDLSQSFVYAADRPLDAIPWLRLSSAAAGIAAPLFLWYLAAYTGMVPRRALVFFSSFFVLYAAAELFAPGDFAWVASKPLTIVAKLPFLPDITIRQVASGPLGLIQTPASVMFIVYCLALVRRFDRAGRGRETRALAAVLAAVLVAILNDTLVDAGAYRFIYLTEYAWTLSLFFLSFHSSKEILAGSDAIQRLNVSEARLRAMVENLPFNIWMCDAEGRLIFQNAADVATVGLHVGEAYSEWTSPDGAPSHFREMSRRALTGEVVDVEVSNEVDGVRKTYRDIIAPALAGGAIIGSVGIGIDISEQMRAKVELEARLAEKEVLLREIHHRVKNNLQVVASLVNLRADNLKDRGAKEVFIAVQGQVDAIARVHESLYNSDNLATIDFGEYLRKLASEVVAMRGRDGISLDFDIDSMSLDIDAAIPCALIANELVANSLKHAYRGRESGRLSVSLHRRDEKTAVLAVEDDGPGIPENVAARSGAREDGAKGQSASIGMVLVSSLAAQLHGGVSLRGPRRNRVELEFPAN